ncbi:MAG: C4-dicarboxylate ABC transporter, partial [Kiloniellales bacterium]|nr:C4-dicarboxylate ABC transporter [Kiloniellales bacterium]
MKQAWTTLVVVLTLVAFNQPASAERILRMTLQLPITNVLGQNVSAFKEIVERQSGGEIKIEIYP